MKLETGINEKNTEVSTVVPIQTLIPVVSKAPQQKCRFVMTTLVIAVFAVMALVLYMSLSSRVSYSSAGDVGFSDVEYELMAAAMQTKQNFNVRININGEKCVESIHADDRQNIVTFHYTGENGREGGMAMYDFNQGLTAFKDGNGTACFFMNAYDLPVIQLGDLQLKARNKQVLEIDQYVATRVSGLIPDGFLQVSAGPLFADLCQNVPSYWLVLAPDYTVEGERMRRDGFTLHVTVPTGASVAVIILDSPSTDATFVISIKT